MKAIDRVVLFGAGASYGAGHTLPKSPPLGKDLYRELAQYSPESWGNLPADIRKEFDVGFEQGMQILWDMYSSNIALLMRHMTLYLAQFRPNGSGDDLYSQFVEALDGDAATGNILFSTLNYECVLELSARALGNKIEYGDGDSNGSLRVWKLHGSCNFVPESIHAGGGVTFGSGVVFNSSLRPVNPNDAVGFCLGGTGLYPAMALYMNAKPVQIGQATIHGLQKRWGEIVEQAKRVLVIGVRPYPQDHHIWTPLADCEGEVGYVGPKADFEDWRAAHRPDKPGVWVGRRWSDCLKDTADFFAEATDHG